MTFIAYANKLPLKHDFDCMRVLNNTPNSTSCKTEFNRTFAGILSNARKMGLFSIFVMVGKMAILENRFLP